jgi:hypothetical protein
MAKDATLSCRGKMFPRGCNSASFKLATAQLSVYSTSWPNKFIIIVIIFLLASYTLVNDLS